MDGFTLLSRPGKTGLEYFQFEITGLGCITVLSSCGDAGSSVVSGLIQVVLSVLTVFNCLHCPSVNT